MPTHGFETNRCGKVSGKDREGCDKKQKTNFFSVNMENKSQLHNKTTFDSN